MDLRQIVAALLTFSMFLMMANMIKRDHFDSLQVNIPITSSMQYDDIKVTERSLARFQSVGKSPWKEDDAALKPCWSKPANLKVGEQSKGFITFSLTGGPECHASQIADAVAVARFLGATLVLPDIIVMGSKPRVRRYLGDIYDVEFFFNSLDDVVRVTRNLPTKVHTGKLIRVPSRVSENYIEAHIAPLFKEKGSLRLEIYCPTAEMRNEEKGRHLDSYACLAKFETLQLQPKLQQVVDSVVGQLRTFSHKTNKKFIAVDLQKGCQGIEEGAQKKKRCFRAEEVGKFLKKIGFNSGTSIYLTQPKWSNSLHALRDFGFNSGTSIYLTQPKWSNSLDALRDFFPNTYTKESLLPADKKTKFLNSESSDIENVIDFYVCAQSDVFVPATSGLFYTSVAGMRIASGRTQILVPSQIVTSNFASDYLSPYISEKNHLAYSCYC